jgi:hypothetical protein
MPAQRVPAVVRVTEYALSLLGERANGGAWRHAAPVCSLPGNAADGTAGDRRYGLQQMPRLRIAMQHLRDFPDSLGQLRGSFRNRARHLG